MVVKLDGGMDSYSEYLPQKQITPVKPDFSELANIQSIQHGIYNDIWQTNQKILRIHGKAHLKLPAHLNKVVRLLQLFH